LIDILNKYIFQRVVYIKVNIYLGLLIVVGAIVDNATVYILLNTNLLMSNIFFKFDKMKVYHDTF